jgi:hypothetical protein
MRAYGCELIQHAALQLNLSTSACGTAQVLFHRFYYRQSMRKYSVERMAPACLYLASKIEEQPQPISNLLEIFQFMTCARMGKPHAALCEMADAVVGEKREDLTKMESLLLTQLGFVVHTELPYKFLCAYLDFLGLSSNHQLAQRSWNYSNDVFRSDACIRYDAPTLACACIHLAAADISFALPHDPPWWLVFNVTDIDIACVTMVLQQILDMPKAFNVLEPPPSAPTAHALPSSDAAHQDNSLASTAAPAIDSDAGAKGSSKEINRRDVSHGLARGDRNDCARENGRADDRSGGRRVDYDSDRSGGSDNHRGSSRRDGDNGGGGRGRYDSRDGVRSPEHRRDDSRDDRRYESRGGSRDYRRAHDGSNDRGRRDYREQSDSRSGDRGDERSGAARDGAYDRRENNSAGKASEGDSFRKSSRRAGRWDES